MGFQDDDGWWPPPSNPRPARGGIKARSRRGKFGGTWWARRWIEVLESFPIGARLRRGQSYARKGQVLSIHVGKGTVEAVVQGSARRPYDVSIALAPLTRREWRKVAGRMAADLRIAAGLLAGELPEGVEEVFHAFGVSLFPSRDRDLVTRCSCPDPSNPCKHIAAVYYLLAEEFDRDPFLLVTLRGMEREDLVELIGEAGGGTSRSTSAKAAAEPTPEPPVDARTDVDAAPAAELARALGPRTGPEDTLDPDAFWGTLAPVDTLGPAGAGVGGAGGSEKAAVGSGGVGGAGGLDTAAAGGAGANGGAVRDVGHDRVGGDSAGVPEGPASVDASLARGLGPFPFWQGPTPLLDRLEPMYRNASGLAQSLLTGEDGFVPPSAAQ